MDSRIQNTMYFRFYISEYNVLWILEFVDSKIKNTLYSTQIQSRIYILNCRIWNINLYSGLYNLKIKFCISNSRI